MKTYIKPTVKETILYTQSLMITISGGGTEENGIGNVIGFRNTMDNSFEDNTSWDSAFN